MKAISLSLSADKLERRLLAMSSVIENIDSTGKDVAEEDKWRRASWHKDGYSPAVSFPFQNFSKSIIKEVPCDFAVCAKPDLASDSLFNLVGLLSVRLVYSWLSHKSVREKEKNW